MALGPQPSIPLELVPTHLAAGCFERRDGISAQGRVLVWPSDPVHPQLANLVAASMAPLAGIVGGAITTTVVRYRPGQRHVLSVDGSCERVFVKVGQPSDVAIALARAEAIDRILSPLPVRFARVVWASHEWGSVAYGAVPGRPVTDLVRAAHPGALRALATAGAVLARMHASTETGTIAGEQSLVADEVLPRLTATREASAVVRAADYVAVLAPAAYESIRALAAEAESILTTTDHEAETSLLHHDFKCDHLLIHRGGLGIIDLDAVAIGDPASDVARLLADLVWWARPDRRLRLRDAFLTGYGRCNDATFFQRVAAWEALAIIKQAARRISILDPALIVRLVEQLDEARRVLDHSADRQPAGS